MVYHTQAIDGTLIKGQMQKELPNGVYSTYPGSSQDYGPSRPLPNEFHGLSALKRRMTSEKHL